MTLRWKGPDLVHGDELVEEFDALLAEGAIGSQRLANLTRRADAYTVQDALTAALDDLIEARAARVDPEDEHPDLERLVRIYNALSVAVGHMAEAANAIAAMDEAALTARALLHGEG